MRKPQKAVDEYLRGNLVMADLITELGRCLAEGDAAGFVRSLPKDLLDEMVQRLDEFPQTDEGWSWMRVFRVASYVRRVTQEQVETALREQVETERREEARLLRRGVELIRATLTDGSRGGEP